MKFQSRKDYLYSSVIIGAGFLILGLTIFGILKGKMDHDEYWVLPVVIVLGGLLLWFYFGTNYELNEKELIYRSGPFSGKIKIDRITEIVKGKTLWVGIKYAMARKGLIVKFDRYNEIYISPENNETFINKVLEIKNDIKITE